MVVSIKTEKVFLAASLSGAFHGIICLALVVSFPQIYRMDPDPNSINGRKRPAALFWENELKKTNQEASAKFRLEQVPFTAQLSPIASVGHDAKNAMSRAAKSDGDPSLTARTKGEVEQGLSQGDLGLFFNCFKSEWPTEKLAVLIDRSLSMGLGGGWGHVIRGFELLSATAMPDNQIRIWLFDKTVDELAPTGLWSSWSSQRSNMAMQIIRNTRPGGLTDLAGAIRVAALNGATRIVVISDDATLMQQEWISLHTTMRRLGKPLPRICSYRILGKHPNDSLETKCRQSGGWCVHGSGNRWKGLDPSGSFGSDQSIHGVNP